jgi:hypothetical protein
VRRAVLLTSVGVLTAALLPLHYDLAAISDALGAVGDLGLTLACCPKPKAPRPNTTRPIKAASVASRSAGEWRRCVEAKWPESERHRGHFDPALPAGSG